MMARPQYDPSINTNEQAAYGALCCIGISHKTATSPVRGQFAVDEAQQAQILQSAKAQGLGSILVLSTCNRTEIYALTSQPSLLINLLCAHTLGSYETFATHGYSHQGEAAISHLLEVSCGLDSQILGDTEIIGQIKKSFALSKTYTGHSAYLDKLMRTCIQASKRAKSETGISAGITSVASAAVHYLRQNIPDINGKRVLLLGTGGIGKSLCQNLVKYCGKNHIVLMNRTAASAHDLARPLGLQVQPYTQLRAEISKADIVVVATGAGAPTITDDHIVSDHPLVILDMSMPNNVAKSVGALAQIDLVNLDDFTRIAVQTHQTRRGEIALVSAIVAAEQQAFMQWLTTRTFAPTIKAFKEKLDHISAKELRALRKTGAIKSEQAEQLAKAINQKITNRFVQYLKSEEAARQDCLHILCDVFDLKGQ